MSSAPRTLYDKVFDDHVFPLSKTDLLAVHSIFHYTLFIIFIIFIIFLFFIFYFFIFYFIILIISFFSMSSPPRTLYDKVLDDHVVSLSKMAHACCTFDLSLYSFYFFIFLFFIFYFIMLIISFFSMSSTPRTLYDKVFDDHVVSAQQDGTCLLYIDRHLVHEVTSPQAFEGLKIAGRKVKRERERERERKR